MYLADPAPLTRSEVGGVVFESGCSLSALNAQTGLEPPPAADGDTGFLPPGTPVHAITGWPPQCRLGAEHNGRWQLYLALDPGAEYARPATCSVG